MARHLKSVYSKHASGHVADPKMSILRSRRKVGAISKYEVVKDYHFLHVLVQQQLNRMLSNKTCLIGQLKAGSPDTAPQ
nr:hypothetical protein [Hyphomonas sp. 34-62-18]